MKGFGVLEGGGYIFELDADFGIIGNIANDVFYVL